VADAHSLEGGSDKLLRSFEDGESLLTPIGGADGNLYTRRLSRSAPAIGKHARSARRPPAIARQRRCGAGAHRDTHAGKRFTFNLRRKRVWLCQGRFTQQLSRSQPAALLARGCSFGAVVMSRKSCDTTHTTTQPHSHHPPFPSQRVTGAPTHTGLQRTHREHRAPEIKGAAPRRGPDLIAFPPCSNDVSERPNYDRSCARALRVAKPNANGTPRCCAEKPQSSPMVMPIRQT